MLTKKLASIFPRLVMQIIIFIFCEKSRFFIANITSLVSKLIIYIFNLFIYVALIPDVGVLMLASFPRPGDLNTITSTNYWYVNK